MVGMVSPPCAEPSPLTHPACLLPVATAANLAYSAGLQWAARGIAAMKESTGHEWCGRWVGLTTGVGSPALDAPDLLEGNLD